MECKEGVIQYFIWALISCGGLVILKQIWSACEYGRYVDVAGPPGRTCPAKLAWFLQELPSFLIPVILLLCTEAKTNLGRDLLVWTFTLHYFQRTFIYALLTKGRPTPLKIVIAAAIFCSINGFLQGHYMLHCAKYESTWLTNIRLVAGLPLFFLGMAINIHSDHILRNLRKPGEIVCRIPQGGLFKYVSCANFFGEILEWIGYAIATWSFPGFCFAMFTIASIGPRAFHHHRYYKNKFEDYPKSRKAVFPFIF